MLLTRHRAVFCVISTILLALLWSLPASASITCAIRRHGQFVCTYFCQDGFICDTANNRCLPGAALQQQAADARQAAQQSTLAYNYSQASQRAQENSQSTGYDYGSTYYIWDGNPLEIPTPQYRQGGGFSTTSASRPANSQAPVTHYTVRPTVKNRLLALVAAASSFAPGDPNRDGAVNLLRKFVRDNKIPVDVDDLMDCGAPKAQPASDQPSTFQLHWTVPDIQPEIEKRGLCAQARSDDERQACEAYQFGQVVMSVEPELKALCKLQENDFQEKDPDALGACAETKFRNAWASRDGKVALSSGSGTPTAGAKKCPAIDSADNLRDLRDRLRRALAAANVGDEDTSDNNSTPGGGKTPPQLKPDPQPDTAADNRDDDDDPYCAFIARRAVRGELTRDGGDQIPDYCRKAVDKAKSCAEQKCSMADIIDQQERNNAHQVPWGVKDYQAIDKLQSSAP
jgi:hypothetical protein